MKAILPSHINGGADKVSRAIWGPYHMEKGICACFHVSYNGQEELHFCFLGFLGY